MVRYLTIFAALIFAFSISLWAQPEFKFAKGDTVNWGKVKFNQSPLKAKIKIINTGTDTLKIYKVQPGCSCTAAPMDKKVIGPNGDSAFVDLALSIPNKSGEIYKTVKFTTSDPDKREATLILKAEVLMPFKYFPDPRFSFRDARVGKESLSKIIITNTTDHDITLKEVRTEPDYFSVNVKNDYVIKAGQDLELIGKVVPDHISMFMTKLNLKTDDPDLPYVEITGMGSVLVDDQQQGNDKPKGKVDTGEKKTK